MDIDKIITFIPQLLLLFVPGYIALIIKTKYLPQKKPDSFDATLYSILYSFIVGIAFQLLRQIKNYMLPNIVLLGNDYWKQLVYLMLGIALGYCLVKIPRTQMGKTVSRWFNNHLDVNSGVWEKAMRNEKGAWATVYLKNGMIYVGELIFFTDDPNDEKKELILQNYDMYQKNEGPISQASGFSVIIESGRENDRVYLQREDIIAIQIQPASVQPNDKEQQSVQVSTSNEGNSSQV